MAGWLFVALALVSDSNALLAGPSTHVRSEEAPIRELIADGYARSSTFRALVDAADALSCVVYVAHVVKLTQGMEGALLHMQGGSREMPVLRVQLKTNLARDRSIAVLAHELQHVIEAMEGIGRGDDAMSATFAQLDRAHATGASKYETEAAQAITEKVLNELRTR